PQRGPGYLNLARMDRWAPAAADQWMALYGGFYEGDRELGAPSIAGVRVSLPSDKSFVSYETALAHVTTDPPLSKDTELIWNQALLDVVYEYPIASDRS